MKDLYNAIRAFLQPKEVGATSAAIAELKKVNPQLLHALSQFELRVRGFRHRLDEAPGGGFIPEIATLEATRKCSEKLQSLTEKLLRAVCVSYTLPKIAELDPILDAVDPGSVLFFAVEKEMQSFTTLILRGLPGDLVGDVSLNYDTEAGTAHYAVTVECGYRHISAYREISHPVTQCFSLRQAHQFVYENQMAVQDALENVFSWEEFQPTSEEQMRERLRQKIQALADTLSPEEQNCLQAYWDDLSPIRKHTL